MNAKIISIWKGIVSKKSLNAIKSYIDTTSEWTFSENDKMLDVYSSAYTSIANTPISEIIKIQKLQQYVIYHTIM